jgi:hypothetical protein
MISIDLETDKVDIQGDMHIVAEEVAVIIGTVCARYRDTTGEDLSPDDLVRFGVKQLAIKAGKIDV